MRQCSFLQTMCEPEQSALAQTQNHTADDADKTDLRGSGNRVIARDPVIG
jgi:hypothetical protein